VLAFGEFWIFAAPGWGVGCWSDKPSVTITVDLPYLRHSEKGRFWELHVRRSELLKPNN